jgi:hypothetical protein
MRAASLVSRLVRQQMGESRDEDRWGREPYFSCFE